MLFSHLKKQFDKKPTRIGDKIPTVDCWLPQRNKNINEPKQ